MTRHFFTETLSEHYKAWCGENFRFPGYYDFTRSAPINWVIAKCKKKYGFNIKDSEIERLCELRLIDYVEKKNGKRSFPLFVPDRINFIKNVRRQFDYSPLRLQQIIAYEDYLIRKIETAGDLSYEGTSDILDWYIKRTKRHLSIDESTLECLSREAGQDNKSALRQVIRLKGSIGDKKKQIDFLQNKSWDKLPQQLKEEIKKWSFNMQFIDEWDRMNQVLFYNNEILQGYSPQVKFSRYNLDGTNLNFNDISWDYTFLLLNNLDYIDFFKTPHFFLEINDNSIDIKIINSKEVDALIMRIIDKIYSIFRKRLGQKRKAWGEESGRKIAIQQRDDQLRKLYASLRKEKPRIASYRLLDILEEHTEKIGLPISVERIKRIIYSSKNKSKTAANISS